MQIPNAPRLRLGAIAFGLASGLVLTEAEARDLALIVANGDYDTLEDVPGSGDVAPAVAAFQALDFQVISVADGSARDLARALDQFTTAAPEAQRIAVVLQGQVVTSGRDSFLLPVEAAAEPGLPAALRSGIALSAIWPVLAAHQGQAMLVVGTGPTEGAAGPFLTYGADPGEVPNGVTFVSGPAARTGWFAVNALARPGLDLPDALQRMEGLTAEGYLPAGHVFLPLPAEAAPAPVPQPDSDPATELVFWEATRRADTIAAYDAYLRRYPNGPHAAEAKKLAEEIRTEPNRPARLVEDALKLTRDQRREIQRALSLLGHDPRGIDGIFGQGSRTAILDWQTANGVDRTGYLTRDQITLILQQAKSRASELEAEAAARRAEQERQDRAYWDQTGVVGDEAGLRAYLDRYPDGIFSKLARERLAAIEAQNRARAEAQEASVWDQVRAENTAAAYRRYLDRYPDGTFAEEARGRLKGLEEEQAGEGDRRRAEQREAALGINDATRLLIERRLEEGGFEPGPADGTFDSDTRRAIRRFQEARGLTATGYVDEATVVQLLADAVLPPGMVRGR